MTTRVTETLFVVMCAAMHAFFVVVHALPSIPSYAQHPCPSGWMHSSYDDSCNILWPKHNRSSSQRNLPSHVNFAEATAWCASFQAELPVIVDVSVQLEWYRTTLVGNTSGVHWWIGVHADPSVRDSSRWITRTGRSDGFVFDWDLKRSMPRAYDRCVVMHQRGTDASGRVYGGNGKMISVDCEETHSVVCTKQRVPVSITAINHGVPRPIPILYEQPAVITILGNRIPNGTLVSLQSMTANMSMLALPDRAATHCAHVSNITGVSAPFSLTPSDTILASQRLCNGTCMEANFTIPSDWPLVRGANYSLCFYVPLLFAAPNDVEEFQFELLGPNAMLVVQEAASSFLTNICERRTQGMQVVLGTSSPDALLSSPGPPYMFDSPVEGSYDAELREDQNTILPWRNS